MRYEPFRNLFVTPVLPFDDDGSIDEPAYRARGVWGPKPGAGQAYPEVLIDLLHAITAEVDLPIVVHPGRQDDRGVRRGSQGERVLSLSSSRQAGVGAGRPFDAVAAPLGVRDAINHKG